MATVKLMVDGREVSQDRFVTSMTGRMAIHASQQLAERVEEVRCPVHGTAPTIVVEADPPRVKIAAGCCDEMNAAIEAKLRETGGRQTGEGAQNDA